jgi:hypothetical protein
MASDVLRGSTLDHRVGTWFLLAAGVGLVAVGAWPWDTGDLEGNQQWWLRGPFLVAAVPFLLVAVRRLLRPVPVPTLEISRDALRWHDGRRRETTVVRAAVVTVRRHHYKGFALGFLDATGERIGFVPIDAFDRDQVDASLARHRWPSPED